MSWTIPKLANALYNLGNGFASVSEVSYTALGNVILKQSFASRVVSGMLRLERAQGPLDTQLPSEYPDPGRDHLRSDPSSPSSRCASQWTSHTM